MSTLIWPLGAALAILLLSSTFVQKLTNGVIHRYTSPTYGDQLRCEVGTDRKRILLDGHYDTVWLLQESVERPYRCETEKHMVQVFMIGRQRFSKHYLLFMPWICLIVCPKIKRLFFF